MSDPRLSGQPEDYIATLSALVLDRAGCDHLPVDILNLLRHTAEIRRGGTEAALEVNEGGARITLPEEAELTRARCAELLLCLLLAKMGRPFRDAAERGRFIRIFTAHLLCPRPALRDLGRAWSDREMLERGFGLREPALQRAMARCPACYVPRELNIRLAQRLLPRVLPLRESDRLNEISLISFLSGYEDEELRLKEAPELDLRPLRQAVDALIPEHVLTADHPASLWIEYPEDFEAFLLQFDRLDPVLLYRGLMGETPPRPLFGGAPDPSDPDYAEKKEQFLAREAAARLTLANAYYLRHFRPEEAAPLLETLRHLFA